MPFIWDNNVFKTSKRTINLKSRCSVGIYYVTDLVHLEEGCFMTLLEIFLEYYRVVSTIKNSCRNLFGPNVDIVKIHYPFIRFHLSVILKDKRGCKSLCIFLHLSSYQSQLKNGNLN